ncbi:hypothetical protein roselon_03598 [Roseibacterium elongatum DSM 19469]|uniref:HTH gntR-type domain-containing protein n=1 Tax=Roseicyclus elongatus DSM 19469 TaxID=1294273 RepID=W8RWW5_9RHOB|nr:GntR family transcriptional regulator [Roseibacterium elongatum]AHM05843.1 hypothetical protein roselon_03598 [Roseibacterium elongatum DSM 19469]
MADAARNAQSHKALMGLRSIVLGGEVAPGQRLSEPTLSARLGISRTPLRQAIQQLVEEGLLERVPSGGVRVRALSIVDVVDAIELRGVIEGTAARLAAERGAPVADLRACRSVADEIDIALGQSAADVDFERYAALNDRFHDLVNGLCGSEMVMREYQRITALPMARPSAFLQAQAAMSEIRQSLFGAQEQHRAVLQAIEAREGSRAEAICREHARLAHANLKAVLDARRSVQDTVPGLSLVSDTGRVGGG